MAVNIRRCLIRIILDGWRSGVLDELGWRSRGPGLLRKPGPEARLDWIRNEAKHSRVTFKQSQFAARLREWEDLSLMVSAVRGRGPNLLN